MKTLGEWVRVQPLTHKQAIGWTLRLAKGLLVLHELDVAHGRITRSSVLAESPDPRGRAVLVDADEVDQDFHFYSLERIERAGASKDDDVWAIGVLFYHLATGGYPFPGDSRVRVGERIKWMPASSIAAYDIDDEETQRLLDRVFKADEGMRLASLPLLIDALALLDRASDALPPLELGVVTGEVIDGVGEAALSATKSVPATKPASVPTLALILQGRAAVPGAEPPAPAPKGIDDEPTLATEDSLAFPFPQLPESRTSEPPSAGTGPPDVPFLNATPDKASTVDWSKPRPAATKKKKKKRKSASGLSWVLLGALVGVGAVVYLQGRFAAGEAPTPPPHTSSLPGPTPASNASAPASATGSRGPAPSRSASQKLRTAMTGENVNACMLGMFDDDAFAGPKPVLNFVCSGKDPVPIVEKLREALGSGRTGPGSISGSMRLWSQMGWFRLPFVSVARHRCCAPVEPIETELGASVCRFDERLNALGAATVAGDDAAYRAALAGFFTGVGCLSAAPTSKVYGLDAPAREDETTAFRVAAKRLRE